MLKIALMNEKSGSFFGSVKPEKWRALLKVAVDCGWEPRRTIDPLRWYAYQCKRCVHVGVGGTGEDHDGGSCRECRRRMKFRWYGDYTKPWGQLVTEEDAQVLGKTLIKVVVDGKWPGILAEEDMDLIVGCCEGAFRLLYGAPAKPTS